MSKGGRLKKPRRVENPLEEDDVARRVEELILSKRELSSSAMGTAGFKSVVLSLDDREKEIKIRHSGESEEFFMKENQDFMRKSEQHASDYYQKEIKKQKLHKLRETLCDNHSDQVDRLDERSRIRGHQNSSKTQGLMDDLNVHSQDLEETTNYNIAESRRNEHLKREFRSFYETYQLEETQFKDALEGQVLEIEKLSQRKLSTENMANKEENLLIPLKNKFSTARSKENSLKAKLQDMTAKFEMFTELLNDSNGKFTSVKIEMNTKTESSKNLTMEISEFKKKVAQTNLLLDPTEMENMQRGETIHKVQRQIEQLHSLRTRLRAPRR